MSKHTPGPWRIEEHYGKAKDEPPEKLRLCFLSINAGSEIVASTWANPHLANARLIAAAPELLYWLKKLAREEFLGSQQHWHKELFEAIAKAEGRES